ncbi:flavodoxin [Bifidobacterium simiarum]|uniref:Flavodoxin n=1 Tax=Bifidobacterium simiarum TaxID=2045441 RepID=A0A2M9HCN1_9BIFI|nr:flavodoxin [Bifidobacterium simiarum]PJM74542.1 flavodoxin [Bifidobacterium simiarum]
MTSVIVVFSRANENYEVGYVTEGNTAKVADVIAAATVAPIIEILPAEPYPTTYDGTVERVKREMEDGVEAAIAIRMHAGNDADASASADAAFAEADTVYLGYPIWCGVPPLEVDTFLRGHDWTGKTILPFITHGGSGFKETPEHIAALTGADVRPGLAVTGVVAQRDPEAVRRAVDGWLGA